MKDPSKTNPELIEEISSLKQRIKEMENSAADLRQVEEELHRTKAELEVLRTNNFDPYGLTTVGYCTVSEQGLIQRFTPTAATMLGAIRSTLVKQPITRFILKEDHSIYYRHRTQLFETGEPQACELRMVRMDGTTFWAHLAATTVQDIGGAPEYRVVLSDITERKEAESALRTREAKFKEIFETIEDLYYETDSEGIVKLVSPSVHPLTGWSEEDVIGKPATKFYVDPKDREQLYVKLSEKGYVHDFEVFLKKKDGEERLASLSARLIIDNYGQTTGLRGLLRDITERKETEEALRASEEKFRTFFNLPIVGFAITGADSRWIHFNDKLCEILGYSRTELEQKTWLELTPPEDLEKERPRFEKLLAGTRRAADVIKRYIRKDGYLIDVYIATQVVRHSDGSIAYIASIIQDITERKRMERALQESEERNRIVIDNSNNGIAIMKGDEHLYVNQRFVEIFGYDSPSEIIGKSNRETVHPDDFQLVNDINIRRQIGEPVPSRYEFKGIKKDKTPVYLDVSETSTRYQGDSVSLVYLRDITERKEAEKALREAQDMLQIAINQSPSGILIADAPDVRIRIANQAAFAIRGGNAETLTDIAVTEHSQKWQTFYLDGRPVPPEELPLSKAILRGEVSQNQEVIIRHESGEERLVLANASPVRDPDGTIRAGIVIFHDITERKEAEKALQESEDKFRNLAEKSVVGIYLLQDGVFKYANLKLAEILGYGIDEMIEQVKVADVIFPDDWPIVEENLRKRLSGKVDSLQYEFRIQTKDRQVKNAEVYSSRTMYQGRPAVIGTLLDITDRKQAELEITSERAKLKTLSDNAPFGMALINKEGHFTYINTKFTKLFGFELSDIPDGRTWFKKAYPDTEYRHMVISTWIEDLRDAKPGERIPRVFTVICKDNTERIVQFIPSVLVSGDYLMTCEDITELRQLENQLRQAQKMEAIGTLAGGIAHDFNNILTALMGYATLIQMKMDISDPLRPYLDEVFSASEKAVDLTKSLLTFSRQQSVTLVPLNINNTIKEAKKLLWRLLTEDIEFRTSLADDDMIVMADKSQMDQILFNLVANARDAMPKGGILTIETALATIDSPFIKIHGFGEPGEYVQINISDTGIGMDEITRSKIFDPFFTTKEAGKGTGLGLATVYGIMKTHKGYVTLVSTLNKGTTFSIYLPQVRIKVDETENTATPPTGGKETILIAEDNEGVRRYMREVLQKYGYTVREAINGEDAIERFKKHQDIDLIIIDSVMPKKNGRETYEEIHKIDPHIKVIFTSGYTKDIVLDKGIEDEKFDFIAKPLSINKLLQKVREVLDRE